MFFYKKYLAILTAYLILSSFPGHTSQERTHKEQIIPVKIIIDQYFMRNFNEIRTKDRTALPNPSVVTPENFARDIIEQLSARYKQFGIHFLPLSVERISLKERVLLDVEYMNVLKQYSCDSAKLLIGLTGAAFVSTSAGDGEFVVVVGGADRGISRLFSQFASLGIIRNPQMDIENMLNTLDHEMRHIFNATHKKEGVLNETEQKTFRHEGKLAVQKNRLQTFTCIEPGR
ncbi:MAG: hypothetical protein HYX20_04155 [Candidatus Yanofskybacteria bacterium]|nr:hypothetical protein [Candidatus Yanofskybacteria bacterium]